MIFKELIEKCDPEKVADLLDEYYEADVPSHLEVLERLRYIPPVKDSKYRLVLKEVNEENEDNWVDVAGFHVEENQLYAIEFQPWGEWLAMEVDEVTLATFSPDHIVGHSLHEMTFVSFDEDEIQSKMEYLTQMVEDVKSGKAETRTFTSVKEMYKDLTGKDLDEELAKKDEEQEEN